MLKYLELHLILVLILSACIFCKEYEDKIKFDLFNGGPMQVTTFNKSLADQGCNMTGNFSLFAHGWQGSYSPWIIDMINNLTFYRPGCVVFMNYSYFSDRYNYFELLSFFKKISYVMTKKLRQISDEGVSGDQIFMFGFSFGARVVIEAALNFGIKKVAQIDVCDAAGPGFDSLYKKDPKMAAKNVQCIHTSNDLGTKERNCHQNWLMGHCGEYQPVLGVFDAVVCSLFQNCSSLLLFSHTACPPLYISAFKNDFIVDTHSKCLSNRLAKNLPVNFKMGCIETRKNSSIIGDIPALTSKSYPYTG